MNVRCTLPLRIEERRSLEGLCDHAPPPNPPLAGGKEGFDSGCVHVGRAAWTVEQDGASDSVHVSVLEANGV